MHRPFVEGGGRGGKGEWDASSIKTYMVFGFKKTGVFSKVGVDGKERKLCETRDERGFPETKGMEREKEREKDCTLDRRSGYCRYNEAKARFLPFHPHASVEMMSRMTDCAISLAAEVII